jgi:hypothetical protein
MSKPHYFDRYISPPSSSYYQHIIEYMGINGPDFKTESKDAALCYVKDLENTNYEGGLYAIELEGKFFIITP